MPLDPERRLVLDYKRRVAAFLADKEDAHSHDMPCWERFKQLVGSDAEAKKLFVEMLEAEGPLLETAAAGNAAAEAIGDAILLRSQHIALRASQVVHVGIVLPATTRRCRSPAAAWRQSCSCWGIPICGFRRRPARTTC